MSELRETLSETLTLLLAGGQGERLHPLTKDRAKPAVPFAGGYRIIDFTLSNCLNSGLRRVYVLTQYKSLSLDRHIRRGWDVLSEEVREFVVPVPPQMRLGGSWYRGTADAVFQNVYTLERDRPKYVVVLSGDHVYKMDYAPMLAFHRERRADLTLACIEVPKDEAPHFGIATTDVQGRVRAFLEKPTDPGVVPARGDRCLASMGVYVFSTEALVRRVSLDAKRKTAHDFGRDVIPDMIDRDRVFAYPLSEANRARTAYWRDIGRLDSYHEANLDLVSSDPPLDLDDSAWPIRTASRVAPPFRLLPGRDGEVPVVEEMMAAAGTRISGATVRRSVLGYNVSVEEGAVIEDSVIFDWVEVARGAVVRGAIVDKGVRIPAGEAIGADRDRDRGRFTVTPRGVTVVPVNLLFPG